MSKSCLPILWCFLSGIPFLFGQDYDFDFVSIDQGLSQSSVNIIAQDKKGFLWLGTQDGLNRYDGHQFKSYKKDPFDSTSLSSNFITALIVDQFDKLWVGTVDGLHLFDSESQTFRRFAYDVSDDQSISNNRITLLYEDLNQNIWVGTSNGFNLIQRTEESSSSIDYRFLRFQSKKNIERSGSNEHFIAALLQDQQGKFWVGTSNGLFHYQSLDQAPYLAQKERLIYFTPKPNAKKNGIQSIRALVEDKEKHLWIGTHNGLVDYWPAQSKFTIHQSGKQNQLNNNYISFLFCKDNGDLLIGTESGLHQALYNEENIVNGFRRFSDTGNTSTVIQGTFFSSIFKDQVRKDFYWLGTNTSGFCKMYKKRKRFYTNHLDDIPELNGRKAVFHLVQDKEDWLWMVIEGQLLRFDRETGAYHIDATIPSTESDLPVYRIRDLETDSAGNVWANTPVGLYRLEKKANQQLFAHAYPPSSPQCRDPGVFAFYESEDAFWVGTFLGINRLDKASGKMGSCSKIVDPIAITHFDYRVSRLHRDRKNNFWVGSNMGLALFRNIDGTLNPIFDQEAELYKYDKHNPKGMVDNFIFDLIEDQEGNIWIGTQNGLVKAMINETSVDFKAFSEADGLANNVIYGILEHEATGYLWLSTNNGLSRFDPKTEQVENFDVQDGLQSNEFNGNAFYKGNDGWFYFGGVNGLSWFQPEEIQLDRVSPPVWITEISINDQSEYNLLNWNEQSSLELDYQQNSFSIHFTGIDFLYADELTYYYDLEGSDIKDMPLGNSQQVNFTNLSPGEYTFCVKAAGKGGLVNQLGDSIQLQISAPFWQTNWFYTLLLVAACFLIWGLYHLNYRLKMSQLNEIEQVRRDAARDFHDELGSKLSIISMYSMLAKDQNGMPQNKSDDYLGKVINTSNSLHDSMRNLLWTLNPEADTIKDLFLQLKDFGEEVFNHSGIAFKSNGLQDQMEQIQLSMEYKRHLLLIFKEAMNNALRHAACSRVELEMKMAKEILIIELNDNGKGFDEQLAIKGEGLNNMKSRAKKMGAKLAFFNEKGTQIKLTCLLGKIRNGS